MCHLVWHFCRASDTRRLKRTQEKGLRAVFNDRNSGYQALLDRPNLPTLRNTRRLKEICILMYKMKNGLSPKPVRDLFTTQQSVYILRQSVFAPPCFAAMTSGKAALHSLVF